MKRQTVLMIILTAALLISCGNKQKELTLYSVPEKKGKAMRVAVDSGEYIDVSDPKTDASLIDCTSFVFSIADHYQAQDAVMKIERGSNRIRITIPKLKAKGFEGKSYEAYFSFGLKNSGKNLVYLYPVFDGKQECYIDGKEFDMRSVPVWMFYIPLYGYGENRIETSSVLKEDAFVYCATWWRK